MVVEKNHRPRIPALNTKFIVLILFSFSLLISDQKNNYLSILRNSITIALHPIQATVDFPQRLLSWMNNTFIERNELIKENKALQEERLVNLQALQRFDSLVQENIRLREILNASTKLNDNVQIARIISADINPFRHIIVVDKGTQDNLYNGQTMVDTNGVVGQILQTSFLSSQAILISDTDHALPIEVNRNGLRTIAQGNGSYDHLDIPYIPNNTDIRVGDLLVTSGLGGKFPTGYPVALIDKVSRNPSQQFANVSAKPTASLNQIREVMLIDNQ